MALRVRRFTLGLLYAGACTMTAGDDERLDTESDLADPEFYLEHASVATTLGNLHEAVSLLLAAAETKPSRHTLGRAACLSNALGDGEAAVDITTRAIELDGPEAEPPAPELFLIRGLGRSKMGHRHEAIADFETAISMLSACSRAFAMTFASAESAQVLLDRTECRRIQAFAENALSDEFELLNENALALMHLERCFELAESIGHEMRGSNRTCLGCSDDFAASKEARHVSLLLRVAKEETLAQSDETAPTSIRALQYLASAVYARPLDLLVWQEVIACFRGFSWHREQLRASNTLMRLNPSDPIIRTILAHAIQVGRTSQSPPELSRSPAVSSRRCLNGVTAALGVRAQALARDPRAWRALACM